MIIIKNSFKTLVCFLIILQGDISRAQQEPGITGTRIVGGKIISDTQPMQKNENQKKFSDKIKAVRVSNGEWDAFFETNGGPFSIPDQQEGDDSLRNTLQKAYTDGVSVQVTVDSEKEVILSAKASERAPAASTPETPYDDIIKKYIPQQPLK